MCPGTIKDPSLSQQTSIRNVDRWIDAHKNDLVDLTCRLVSIDTTVPPGRNYPRIAQVLSKELKELVNNSRHLAITGGDDSDD